MKYSYTVVYSHAHKMEVTDIIFAQRWIKKFFVHLSSKAVKKISPSPTIPTAIPVVAIRIIGYFQSVMIFYLHVQCKMC